MTCRIMTEFYLDKIFKNGQVPKRNRYKCPELSVRGIKVES